MVFICNLENNVYTLSNSTLNQGSNRASEIVLLAPYAASSVVYIAVTTPDGMSHEPLPMEKAYLPEELPEDISEHWSAWKIDLPGSLTTRAGVMTLQFFIKNGAETIPLSPISKSVAKGVPFLEPTKPEGWDWNAITSALSTITTAASNAETAKGQAEEAQRGAESAAVEAEQARIDAHTFSVNASSSATNALTAAESAAKSADRAANYSKNAKEYTDQRITELVGGAPAALDTLKEIADELKDNDSAVEAILTKVGEIEDSLEDRAYNLSKLDEDYMKESGVNQASYDALRKNFQRVYVERSWKKDKPRGQYSKIATTAQGAVDTLPRNTSKAPDDPTNDILGSIPERQGDFLGDRRFAGHIFTRPELPYEGWGSNDKYAKQIATPKRYVDGINRRKRCVSPYSKCIYLDKTYILSVDGDKGEGESLIFACENTSKTFARVKAEITLQYDYRVAGSGLAFSLAVKNGDFITNHLAWFTLLENQVELKYNHVANDVFENAIKFRADVDPFYNVENDKIFTLTLEYTADHIACYINGKCIKEVTDHNYKSISNLRPVLCVNPSEEMTGEITVYSAGVYTKYSDMAYVDLDDVELGHLPRWSEGAVVYGVEHGAGVNKWSVLENDVDGTQSVNRGYVNGKLAKMRSESSDGGSVDLSEVEEALSKKVDKIDNPEDDLKVYVSNKFSYGEALITACYDPNAIDNTGDKIAMFDYYGTLKCNVPEDVDNRFYSDEFVANVGYVRSKIGDIESALDELISYTRSLGGA